LAHQLSAPANVYICFAFSVHFCFGAETDRQKDGRTGTACNADLLGRSHNYLNQFIIGKLAKSTWQSKSGRQKTVSEMFKTETVFVILNVCLRFYKGATYNREKFL